MGQRLVVLVAHGELRVVDLDRAGADQHHVALSPQAVGVDAGDLRGDPATAAVGGGTATVQGRGELPGDEGPVVLHPERPRAVERPRLALHQPERHLDPGLAQGGLTAGGHGVRVGLREDDPGDACRGQRLGARPRPTGVVARLERHDRRRPTGVATGLGQRSSLGVRRPGAAVVALRDLRAAGVQEHAADPRVGTERHAGRAREVERATHRALLRCAELHLVSLRVRSRTPGRGHVDRVRRSRDSCVLLLIRTLTVGPGVPPGQPDAPHLVMECGRVADF